MAHQQTDLRVVAVLEGGESNRVALDDIFAGRSGPQPAVHPAGGRLALLDGEPVRSRMPCWATVMASGAFQRSSYGILPRHSTLAPAREFLLACGRSWNYPFGR